MENFHEAAMHRRISRFAQREQRNKMIVQAIGLVSTGFALLGACSGTTFWGVVGLFIFHYFFAAVILGGFIGIAVAISDRIEDGKDLPE